MTPKRFEDRENFALYEKVIKDGRSQFERGESTDWEEVKIKLDRLDH